MFSRTRLEFRLLWNKLFQKDDEELGWLLNPYRQSTSDATMMSSFNKNTEDSGGFGRESVTIHNLGLTKKGDSRRKQEKKSFGEGALEVARYMGMGVYMTSTSFPSPFLPINDANIFDESRYDGPQNVYAMSKIW